MPVSEVRLSTLIEAFLVTELSGYQLLAFTNACITVAESLLAPELSTPWSTVEKLDEPCTQLCQRLDVG